MPFVWIDPAGEKTLGFFRRSFLRLVAVAVDALWHAFRRGRLLWRRVWNELGDAAPPACDGD